MEHLCGLRRETPFYLHCPQTHSVDHPGIIAVNEKGKLPLIIEEEKAGELVIASFLDEYPQFFRAVGEGTATYSNLRDAANTIRVAEAIEKEQRL